MPASATLPKVYLPRKLDNGKQTVGELIYNAFKCDTLELPWKNNQKRVSCIPADTYLCVKCGPTAAIKYPHFHITNVPGRDGIKVHRVNFVRSLAGCVGVGTGFKDIDLDGEIDIINSKVTLDKLLALLPDKFELVITNPPAAV